MSSKTACEWCGEYAGADGACDECREWQQTDRASFNRCHKQTRYLPDHIRYPVETRSEMKACKYCGHFAGADGVCDECRDWHSEYKRCHMEQGAECDCDWCEETGECPGCETGVDSDGPHKLDSGKWHPACCTEAAMVAMGVCPGCEAGIGTKGAHKSGSGKWYPSCEVYCR